MRMLEHTRSSGCDANRDQASRISAARGKPKPPRGARTACHLKNGCAWRTQIAARPRASDRSLIRCRVGPLRYAIDVVLEKPETVHERVDHVIVRAMRENSQLAQECIKPFGVFGQVDVAVLEHRSNHDRALLL